MLTCCKKNYYSKQSLAKHRRDHHGGISCDLCNKPFSSKRSLDSHKSRYHKSQFTVQSRDKIGYDWSMKAPQWVASSSSNPNKQNCLLVPVDGGESVPISIPKNLYSAPKCDLRLIEACERAGFKITTRGTIDHDEIDTGINYEKFIRDCGNLCFKEEYENLYRSLISHGFEFFD